MSFAPRVLPWLLALVLGLCLPASGLAQTLRPNSSYLSRPLVARLLTLAQQRAGLGTTDTQNLASRARWRALLPELSVRLVHGLDASVSQAGDFTQDNRATNAESLGLEVRVNFSLDRLVFDTNEIPLLRIEDDRRARRAALGREIIELLASLERIRLRPPATLTAEEILEAYRAQARLEELSGLPMDRWQPPDPPRGTSPTTGGVGIPTTR